MLHCNIFYEQQQSRTKRSSYSTQHSIIKAEHKGLCEFQLHTLLTFTYHKISGLAKNLNIFQHTISMQPFEIEVNCFWPKIQAIYQSKHSDAGFMQW